MHNRAALVRDDFIFKNEFGVSLRVIAGLSLAFHWASCVCMTWLSVTAVRYSALGLTTVSMPPVACCQTHNGVNVCSEENHLMSKLQLAFAQYNAMKSFALELDLQFKLQKQACSKTKQCTHESSSSSAPDAQAPSSLRTTQQAPAGGAAAPAAAA